MAEESSRPLLHVGDIAGLKEPLIKLIDTLGAGAGRTFDGAARIVNTYWLASRDAKNEAERIRLVEGARTQTLTERAKAFAALSANSYQQLEGLSITGNEVSAQLSDLPQEVRSLHERAQRRMALENAMQQLNREAVVEHAAAELANEERVSEEPVEPDWVTRFWRTAQDISNEEMQLIFGKILAGEVKQPGTFSPRTLDFLATLTKKEAQSFRELCSFAWHHSGNINIILFGTDNEDFFITVPDYEKIQHMHDIGLIEFVVHSANAYIFHGKERLFSYGGMYIIVEAQGAFFAPEKHYVPGGIIGLTQIGKELARVCQPEINPCVVDYATKHWMEAGCAVSCLIPVKKPSDLKTEE
jgi:hypothetical protein